MDTTALRVGDWLLEPQLNRISNAGIQVALEPRAAEVLAYLATHPGDVVSTDELIQALWGRPFVGDSPVYRIIAELRRSLGDDARAPRYIQTIRKRGYRLVAPVDRVTPEERPSQDASGHRAGSSAAGVVGGAGNAHDADNGDNEDGPRESCPESVLPPALVADFEWLRTLAKSDFSEVHLARERELKRLVAIKLLTALAASDPVSCQRFRREAQSAARISHPAVAAIHRIGGQNARPPYIVMEYIPGRNLADTLVADGPFDAERCRAMLIEVAAALAAAHDAGVIHRDVKPSNVLISEDGRYVLTDFGMAAFRERGTQLFTRITREGEIVGDLRYVSPERLRGEKVTTATDVYSLAVAAYEALTGRWPYEGASEREMRNLPIRKPPLPLPTDLPQWLCGPLLRCLAKNPLQRPTANDLAYCLRERCALPEPVKPGARAGFRRVLRSWFIRRDPRG